MVHIKRFLAVLAPLILFVSCQKRSEHRLQEEILVSTVWLEQVTNADKVDEYLYVFDNGGMMSVYLITGDECELQEQSRYILQMEYKEIAIEYYGVFKIVKIDVNQLYLKGSNLELDLKRYTGPVKIPQPKV